LAHLPSPNNKCLLVQDFKVSNLNNNQHLVSKNKHQDFYNKTNLSSNRNLWVGRLPRFNNNNKNLNQLFKAHHLLEEVDLDSLVNNRLVSNNNK